MYIIEKLKGLNNTSAYGSGEFVLSQYFLNHLNQIPYLNLKKVAMETNLSKSSIIRFCQKGGFDGFTIFLDELAWEREDLLDRINDTQQPLVFDEEMRLTYFKEAKQFLAPVYPTIMNMLNTSQQIVLYGHERYISCFQRLVSKGYLMNKQVTCNMCWDIDKQAQLFASLNSKDVIMIAEPNMDYHSFIESLTIKQDSIKLFEKTAAKLIFIGQNDALTSITTLPVPFSYDDILYQDYLIYLDYCFSRDLKLE